MAQSIACCLCACRNELVECTIKWCMDTDSAFSHMHTYAESILCPFFFSRSLLLGFCSRYFFNWVFFFFYTESTMPSVSMGCLALTWSSQPALMRCLQQYSMCACNVRLQHLHWRNRRKKLDLWIWKDLVLFRWIWLFDSHGSHWTGVRSIGINVFTLRDFVWEQKSLMFCAAKIVLSFMAVHGKGFLWRSEQMEYNSN